MGEKKKKRGKERAHESSFFNGVFIMPRLYQGKKRGERESHFRIIQPHRRFFLLPAPKGKGKN